MRRRREAGRVAHRGALDRRLRAVEEGIEHLWVEPADARLLRRQAPVLPDRVRRRLCVVRLPLVAAARGHHRKARRARPVHQVADDRGLVAVGQAVHHARLRGLLRQQRPAVGVGLDRHHHHVLAVGERRQRVLDRGHRVAGGLDHDVDRRMRHQRLPVLRNVGAAVLERRIERRRLVALGLPADPLQVPLRVGGRQVGDAGQVHPRRVGNLCDVHGAELARADHPDANRIFASLQQLRVEIHGRKESGIDLMVRPLLSFPPIPPREYRLSTAAARRRASAGNRPAGTRSG